MQGTESEMSNVLKRHAELELQLIQQQGGIEIALRDKRNAENDLDLLRDKMKVLLKEKLELENNMNMIQKHELTRLNELEQKFSEVSEQYIKAKEELAALRVTEINLNE